MYFRMVGGVRPTKAAVCNPRVVSRTAAAGVLSLRAPGRPASTRAGNPAVPKRTRPTYPSLKYRTNLNGGCRQATAARKASNDARGRYIQPVKPRLGTQVPPSFRIVCQQQKLGVPVWIRVDDVLVVVAFRRDQNAPDVQSLRPCFMPHHDLRHASQKRGCVLCRRVPIHGRVRYPEPYGSCIVRRLLGNILPQRHRQIRILGSARHPSARRGKGGLSGVASTPKRAGGITFRTDHRSRSRSETRSSCVHARTLYYNLSIRCWRTSCHITLPSRSCVALSYGSPAKFTKLRVCGRCCCPSVAMIDRLPDDLLVTVLDRTDVVAIGNAPAHRTKTVHCRSPPETPSRHRRAFALARFRELDLGLTVHPRRMPDAHNMHCFREDGECAERDDRLPGRPVQSRHDERRRASIRHPCLASVTPRPDSATLAVSGVTLLELPTELMALWSVDLGGRDTHGRASSAICGPLAPHRTRVDFVQARPLACGQAPTIGHRRVAPHHAGAALHFGGLRLRGHILHVQARPVVRGLRHPAGMSRPGNLALAWIC